MNDNLSLRTDVLDDDGAPHGAAVRGSSRRPLPMSTAADKAAVRLYEQSRENGSYHELALRIATAAWRNHYPETTVAAAEDAVRSAVQMAQRVPTRSH